MTRQEERYPAIPHEVTGCTCIGCLTVKIHGDLADIRCTECGEVVRTVPKHDATATLIRLAATQVASARCTHCHALNTFPGFTIVLAFVCWECGGDCQM